MLNLALTRLVSELRKLPASEQSERIRKLATVETVRDREALQKRAARSASAEIAIPPCKAPERRKRCLADPVLFLRTYFADRYELEFNEAHLFMIRAIVQRAAKGGRQAVAAPRGIGKSEVTKGLLVYAVLAGLVRFPLIVAATSELAKKIYVDFKKKLATNDLLLEDFPEVCYPVRALEGAPQRAARQHVAGRLTGIVWTDDYISLPHVAGSQFGGVKMSYYGLDSAFRGVNIDGDRPDFILIDDPETRESAKSHDQIEDREAILDKDIAGLVGQVNNLAMVVLTTVQNRICLSYKLTDPKQKSAWNGKRFGLVHKWPVNADMWEQYIELRKTAQVAGDEFGLPAMQFYLQHREEMDAGAELLSNSFVSVKDSNNNETVFSALQQVYNQISDTSKAAFETEYQNDPPEEAGPQGSGITPALVGSRISGLVRWQVPADATAITAAIDLGKYRCHWVVIAWRPGAGGCIIDYGIAEVVGTDKSIDNEASEPMIYQCLLNWRDELLNKPYTDTTGTHRKVDWCFVDSGTFTNAAYEFCRQVGGIFHCSKGLYPYTPRKQSTANVIAGANLHAAKLAAQNLWLYELDTSHWKQFVHERFLTPTFDENNMLRRGALSIFSLEGSQQHTSFAHHIASEEWVREFVEGKGVKERWAVRNDNNHWFDATCYAAAASEVCGVRLFGSEVQTAPKAVEKTVEKQQRSVVPKAQQHGVTRIKRQGGWVPKRRW